jgi:hypothetical protein
MRCALECPIEAKIKLTRDLDSRWFNGKRLIIRRDEGGYASVIRIEGKVAERDMIKMVVEKLPNGMTHFNSSGGIKIREELEEELKLVESTLGLFCKLSRVRWEYASSTAIPETPDEQQDIQWNSLKWGESEENTEVSLPMEDFWAILNLGHFARDLSVTMAFFREGSVDLRVRRYITAYFSFYFVLEGLYANGRFGNREVRAEFGKSETLKKCIEEVLPMPLYNRSSRTNDVMSLDDFLKVVNKPKTVDGVIHLLVWLRGDLHHFVNNPKKLTGSPFTHRRYQTVAWFIHDICTSALRDEVVARFPVDDDPRRKAPENQASMI